MTLPFNYPVNRTRAETPSYTGHRSRAPVTGGGH
jgi:hypothetical protein